MSSGACLLASLVLRGGVQNTHPRLCLCVCATSVRRPILCQVLDRQLLMANLSMLVYKVGDFATPVKHVGDGDGDGSDGGSGDCG